MHQRVDYRSARLGKSAGVRRNGHSYGEEIDMSFIGDLFGGGGSEVTSVEQTSTSEPPAYALPHLTRLLSEGENLF